MKPKLIILTLLVLVALAIIPSSAMTLTMANPNGVAERDYILYFFNGTMSGFYNSTSVIPIADTSVDYILTVKPLQTNYLEDPGDWLTNNALPFVQSNVVGLVVLVVLAAMWRRG